MKSWLAWRSRRSGEHDMTSEIRGGIIRGTREAQGRQYSRVAGQSMKPDGSRGGAWRAMHGKEWRVNARHGGRGRGRCRTSATVTESPIALGTGTVSIDVGQSVRSSSSSGSSWSERSRPERFLNDGGRRNKLSHSRNTPQPAWRWCDIPGNVPSRGPWYQQRTREGGIHETRPIKQHLFRGVH